jgi:hypothetical protein
VLLLELTQQLQRLRGSLRALAVQRAPPPSQLSLFEFAKDAARQTVNLNSDWKLESRRVRQSLLHLSLSLSLLSGKVKHARARMRQPHSLTTSRARCIASHGWPRVMTV